MVPKVEFANNATKSFVQERSNPFKQWNWVTYEQERNEGLEGQEWLDQTNLVSSLL